MQLKIVKLWGKHTDMADMVYCYGVYGTVQWHGCILVCLLQVSPHPVPLAGVAVAALVSGVVTIGYSYLSLAGVL